MKIEELNDDNMMFNYAKLSTAIEKILPKNEFRLSCLKDTNDPRENAYKTIGSIGWGLPDNFIELQSKARTEIDKIIRFDYKVMFLCSNQKPKIIKKDGSHYSDELVQYGWQKSRMWSQYGIDHTGLCLVFNRDFIEKRAGGYVNSIYNKLDFVSYTLQNYYEEGGLIIDGNELINDKLEKYPMNYVMKRIKKLLFTKCLDYRDESEYRIAIYDPENKYVFMNIEDSLKAVIIGHSTPEIYYDLITSICKKNNLSCFKMDWSRGQGRIFQIKI